MTLKVSILLGVLFLSLSAYTVAQPGPQGGPPGPPAHSTTLDPAAVLAAGQALLENTEALAVFEHVHGRSDEKREIKVLLGDEQGPYGRFNLDPATLEPVPLGLEELVAPLPENAVAADFFRRAEQLQTELSLSTTFVPEPRGYKLLLVYGGRIVGELKLSAELTPALEPRWADELQASSWRYP